MKVTRLGNATPLLTSGLGYASQIPAPTGAAGTVVTSNGSNGAYWGENIARITANGSNANPLVGPFVNFSAGSNITFSWASNSLTIHGQAGGAGGGAIITSNGSNSLAAIVNLVAGSGIALGVSGQDITITNTGQGGGGGGSGGALVLLEQHTASSSSSLDFTTRNASGQSGATFQSDFDMYEIVCVNIVPATNATALWLRVTTDGGSTYKSGATDYQWSQFFEVSNASSNNGSGGDTKIGLIGGGGSISNTASRAGGSGTFRIYGPLDTGVNTTVHGHGQNQATTNSNLSANCLMSGQYLATTAVNGFQILMSSGNITSGTVRVYGIAK